MPETRLPTVGLGGDELALQQSVRALAAEHFAPTYLQRAAREELPTDALAELARAGLMGLLVPVEHGGEGATALALGIACEELGRADAAVAYLAFGTNVPADLISRFGTEEVRKHWLPRLLDGSAVVCLGITEPGSGSDAGAMRMRADRVDGGWRVTGEKTSVTLAAHAHAAVVFARTGEGVTAFLVPTDQEGVSRQRFSDPGFRPLGRGSITLDDVFVADDHVIGEVGRAFPMILEEFDLTRTLIALMVLGTARGALQLTGEYVTQRTAFGRPLSANQGVSFPLAEHATRIEAATWLAYRSLSMRDAGQRHTTEAAMLKWWAPEVAYAAILDCVVLHGHVGWSEEMPLQAMLRDVSGYFIGDGTPQIQKLVIARAMLGREFVG